MRIGAGTLDYKENESKMNSPHEIQLSIYKEQADRKNKRIAELEAQVAQLWKALEECQFLLRNYESCECDIMEPPCPKCIVLKEVDDALKGER